VANGLLTQAGRVLPEWLDVNGHMNSAWYDVVFDRAESALFDAFGIDEDYTRRTGQGVFRLEKRLRYLRELLPDTPFRVQSRITMTDLRHIRHRHHLLHAETGAVMAVKEAHSLHVDLARRKAVPVAHPPVREALSRLAAEHADLPDPAP
jgi:acyl-CoA thioester hydrolase